ncbi:PGF-pre-PGF domain-containing protein [Halobium palmae]|uniref:PGF-pre-PGF domain-containing protein n=1 Tax=Halobium palmae TaxID=1776492 RepID=A0ABD5RVX2_9EURY
MTISDFSRVGAVLFSMLLLVSTVAPVTALAGIAHDQSAPHDMESDDKYVSITDDVKMWERAPLPLRTDPSDADTVVENHDVFFNLEEAQSGSVPANKERLAIYGSDDTIPIDLQSVLGAGTESFAGTEVRLLVAKMDGLDTSSPSMTSDDFSEAMDQPRELLKEEANNENVDYEWAGKATIDENGDASFSYDLKKSNRGAGHYMFFLVADSGGKNGFTVTDGELAVNGDARVLGFDGATAHEEPSNVAPPTRVVMPGENVTFTVANSEGDGDIHHTVMLYNESMFTDTQTSVHVTGSMDDGISDEDVSIERSIDMVNGAAHELNTERSESKQYVGSTDFGELIEMVESDSETEVSDSNPKEDVTFDASVTKTTKPGSENTSPRVKVETLDNWSTGEYRWVHVAVNEDGTIVSSNTGTLSLGPKDGVDNGDDDDDDGPSNPSAGGGGGGGGAPGGKSTKVSSPSSSSAEMKISQNGADDRYRIQFEDHTPERNGISLSGLTVQMREWVGSLSVKASIVDDVPSDVARPPTKTAGFFSIESTAPESSFDGGVFRFSLSDERLDALGVAPDDVTLYRYHNGKWHALETRHKGENSFAANTPGFSYFAIGASSSAASSLSVTNIDLDRTSVAAGESVTLSATVENTGSASGSKTIDLLIDGNAVQTKEIELGAGESSTIDFSHTFEEAGSYTLGVTGADGTSVTVESVDDQSGETNNQENVDEPATEDDGVPNTGGNSGLLIGAVVLFLVVIGVGAIYYGRRP